MTTCTYLSQLEALAKKLEFFVQSLQSAKIYPSKDQYTTFKTLSLTLSNAVAAVPVGIEALKKRQTDSCEHGTKLMSQAVSDRNILITTTHLNNRQVFARNIKLFFEGPQDSAIDSDTVKGRKRLTRERCERICSLSPDGLISWAVAFAPSLWTANLMSNNTFDSVEAQIEPQCLMRWPPEINHILSALAAEEPLQGSQKYLDFLKSLFYFGRIVKPKADELLAAEDGMKNADDLNEPRKRRRVIDEPAPDTEQFSVVRAPGSATGDVRTTTRPSETIQRERQIQYMFSKAPISQIPLLGDLLSEAVQSSHHWNMERQLGELTTDCIATVIPKDENEDISITLLVGQRPGLRMNNIFKLQQTWRTLL